MLVVVLVEEAPPVLPPPAPPLPPAPPMPPVEVEVSGSQLAVWSAFFTHSKPRVQPQIVQSPAWHWPSPPQVSLRPQSLGLSHDPGLPVVPHEVSQRLEFCEDVSLS